MPTIDQLCKVGEVSRVGGVTRGREMALRAVYALPRLIDWFRTVLPTIETDGYNDGAVTPLVQTADVLREFVIGTNLANMDWYPKPLQPRQPDHGVWEIRTPDLRYFGWFLSKGAIILSCGDTKANCIQHGLYAGYRNQTIADRNSLALDEPKFITGDYDDVF